jgi:hypothetical protein
MCAVDVVQSKSVEQQLSTPKMGAKNAKSAGKQADNHQKRSKRPKQAPKRHVSSFLAPKTLKQPSHPAPRESISYFLKFIG